MASRNTPRSGRTRRLPRHLNLDYTLTPAPANLSISTVAEKSPLPAIVVTPSSPSSEKRFSIAFLAPPKKPTARERMAEYFFPKPPQPASPSPETEPLFRSGSQVDDCSAWSDTWRGWTSSVNAPIALPVTSPISGNAPSSWHKAPAHQSIAMFFRRPSTRWTIVAFLGFLLVLFHTFNHYLESSAGSLRSRDLGITQAEIPIGNVAVSAVGVEDGPAVGGLGKDSAQGWKDWQGWYKLNHGRGGRGRSQHHVPPQLQAASPTSVPAAIRSALARNEV